MRAAKIKLIIASRDAWCKRTVKCLQRMVVSALHAAARGYILNLVHDMYINIYRPGCTRVQSCILVDLDSVKLPGMVVSLCTMVDPALLLVVDLNLVLHYSEGAFFCTTNRGKLLQHKLIRVQCTKKSTAVPEYRCPLYRSTGIGFKKLFLSIVFIVLKKSYF
jgi:hypothetical protein